MTITLTREQIASAIDERDALTRRLARLNRFLDEKWATCDRTRAIITEARDLVAEEKLHLELRLSIAIADAKKAGAV